MKKVLISILFCTLAFCKHDSVLTEPENQLEHSTLWQKAGVNCYWYTPTYLTDSIGLQRLYIGLGWCWRENMELTVEPAHQADGWLDSYLQNAKAHKQEVVPCFSWKPTWMSEQTTEGWQHDRLCDKGKSGDNPNDYYSVGVFAWQLTARYGRVIYADSLLRVNTQPRWTNDPANVKKSGLGLLRYLEIENEPNRWWRGSAFEKYTPEQCAALMSAIWDGHEGQMGSHVGVKNADPTMKVVLPGLAFMEKDYLLKMKKWFEQNRSDKKFCADVINVHHYSNSENAEERVNVSGVGISPKNDNFGVRCEVFTNFCRVNIPEVKELWLSEFGWDTGVSTQSAGYTDKQQNQAEWVIAAYQEGLSSGFDKMFLYELTDQLFGDGLFQRSGLVEQQQAGYKKKIGYTYLVNYINY